jgi:hypothetical protein
MLRSGADEPRRRRCRAQRCGGVAQMSRADDDAERSDAEEWRR